MTIEKVDVFVSGGGIAGMVATIAFEQLGYSVICADPEPPAQTREAASADLRTTAFLQPNSPSSTIIFATVCLLVQITARSGMMGSLVIDG